MNGKTGLEISSFPNDRTPWSNVLQFSLPAITGCEAHAIEIIADQLNDYRLRPNRLSRLKVFVRDAVLKVVDEASLSSSSRTINFQVHVSSAVIALKFGPTGENVKTAQVGWGFFLVQLVDRGLNEMYGGQKVGELTHTIRLYVYVEGDQVEESASHPRA